MGMDRAAIVQRTRDLTKIFTGLMSTFPSDIFNNNLIEKKDSSCTTGVDSVILRERIEAKIRELKARRNAKEGDSGKLRKEEKILKSKLNKVKTKPPVPLRGGKPDHSDSTAVPQEKGKSFNKDDRILYSKFDLIDRNDMPSLDEKNKKKKLSKLLKKSGSVAGLTGKNYDALVKANIKKKEDLAELKTTNPEKAQKLENQEKWQTALLRAEGVKVKDDVKLLKRAAKREEKKKKVSHKKWTDRAATVTKQQEDKQNKRKANIQARRDGKRDKKMDKAKKKGRYLPEMNNA